MGSLICSLSLDMICQKHLEGLVVPEPSIPRCCAVEEEVVEVVVENRDEFWARTTAVPQRTTPNNAERKRIINAAKSL